MKQKVSDYIADHIAEWGIRDVFTVTGGGAMHMNDAFGHHPKLHCTYQHHEQACAMAAEAYARMDNRMAAVCVTTGPGATNAITGVLGGWMDSIPMLVFSGQARYATTVAASGLKLRSMGVQECNIVPVVTSITKYAQMIIHPEDIRYHLEKALYMAVNGRPGPVWLDIPLDVQGAVIDTEKLRGYDPQENPEEKPAEISQDVIQQILDKIEKSRRPVLFPGNGVRLAGAMDDFQKLVNILGVPVITGLEFGHIVLHQPLPVADQDIFGEILNLTQVLNVSGIQVDRINYSSYKEAELVMGDITVELGNSDSLDGKIAELHDIMPELSGLSGTLYLDTYDETNSSPTYRFVKKN